MRREVEGSDKEQRARRVNAQTIMSSVFSRHFHSNRRSQQFCTSEDSILVTGVKIDSLQYVDVVVVVAIVVVG